MRSASAVLLFMLVPACLPSEGKVGPAVPTTPPVGSPVGDPPVIVTEPTEPVVLPAPDPTAPDPTEPDPVVPPARCETCFVAHEWGTFTSVQDSSGRSFAGLHHEDEPLPNWVHRRNFHERWAYYFEELTEEPLQQLETPVIYFHNPEKMAVKVEVEFPEGLISQWYPDASSYLPAMNEIEGVRDGAMTWDVTIDPAIDPASFQPVEPDEIWAPSRRVASTPVQFDNAGYSQVEQFIFYRGIGNFDLPVRVTSTDTTLTIRNGSEEALPMVAVLRVTEHGAKVVSLGALAAGKSLVASVPTELDDLDTYRGEAHQILWSALVKTGLYEDEAKAMVDTWTRSWFGNHGLRVLYVVPRAWTDALLPIRITPTPDELVRTLVGRIEVLRPSDEIETHEILTHALDTTDPTKLDALVDALGRFAEPRLRRLFEDVTGDALLAPTASDLIERAHDRP